MTDSIAEIRQRIWWLRSYTPRNFNDDVETNKAANDLEKLLTVFDAAEVVIVSRQDKYIVSGYALDALHKALEAVQTRQDDE